MRTIVCASDFLPTSKEMEEFDAQTLAFIAEGHSSDVDCSDVLMERVGEKITERLLQEFSDNSFIIGTGPGNNGGDGFVVARKLLEKGKNVVACTTGFSKISPLWEKKANAFIEAGGEVFTVDSDNDASSLPRAKLLPYDCKSVKAKLCSSFVAIDAFLGIGQSGSVRGALADLITAVRPLFDLANKIVAIDCPTGIDCNNGQTFDSHIQADLTLAIQNFKLGQSQYPARAICGKMERLEVGIGTPLPSRYTLSGSFLAHQFAQIRRSDSHKGNYGHTVVFAGSVSMPGAAYFAIRGALEVGTGLGTIAAPGNVFKELAFPPECMRQIIGDKDYFCEEDIEQVKDSLKRASAVVIGPGVGKEETTKRFLTVLIRACAKLHIPTIVDAEGLDLIGPELLQGTIITPHPGEAAKLLNMSPANIQKDRIKAAERLLEFTKASVVALKGASTIICSSSRLNYVNPTGNPWMASGGMGDILAGMIAGFVAQGYKPAHAVSFATFLHGMAADRILEKRKAPISPSELLAEIKPSISTLY